MTLNSISAFSFEIYNFPLLAFNFSELKQKYLAWSFLFQQLFKKTERRKRKIWNRGQRRRKAEKNPKNLNFSFEIFVFWSLWMVKI